MSLGIRGSNPIWVLVNLAGKLFDDTYYMWVLDNQIPYIPATVYQDPDLNTPWSDPIQFLGNGTLPDNVYFQSGVVYRLEFRQHIGLGPPTQQDPLIDLVENYIAGAGGSTPIDTVAFASSNQITNPQFALIDFTTPFTYTGAATSLPISGLIQIGPGWFLELAGSGTVTLTQVPLTSANPNPSNAPYALEITLSGWSDNSVFLRQRFYQNGLLWANQIVSTTITAAVNGSNEVISANLVDSLGSTLGQVLPLTTVDEGFNEFTGYAQLGPSTDTDTPPAAYIDYKLALPSDIDIYVTSIQLVVQDLPLEPNFEQDSINRQIDHTYHDAYPIIPVGAVIDYAGATLPKHYLLCDGSSVLRAQYPQLFTAIGTIWGSVDSTHFSLPNLTDLVTAGAGGSLFGGALGASGGSATHTLSIGEMPSHNHPGSTEPSFTADGSSRTARTSDSTTSGGTNALTIAPQGGGMAFTIVQQTALMKKCIRFE